MARPKSLVRMILEPIAIAIALAAVVRAAVHIYSIPSASMAPTLRSGDQIVVTRYLGTEPERGHIVVFQSPPDRGELMVKRVVGVPGDLIDSRLGRVRVGGYTLPESYVLRQAASGAIESLVIPAGSYFVLGDNREDSIDSRSWGVVPRELIVGRARMILWSSPGNAHDPARAATSAGDSDDRHVPARARIFKWLR
jgi:signal peptidase I